MTSKIKWAVAIKPLLKKYEGKKHPLEYKNVYQLLVMVVLSAQDSDKHINELAPAFFSTFSSMKKLSAATQKDLYRHIGKVRNFANKTKWLMEIARKIRKDSNIPLAMDDLIELPGIGRKSANVILREAGREPEGVMVDLHVVRVAVRLGIASGKDPKKIEKQIMDILPRKEWDAGMAMSFLGREICRPRPKCEVCLMKNVCSFFQKESVIARKTTGGSTNTAQVLINLRDRYPG